LRKKLDAISKKFEKVEKVDEVEEVNGPGGKDDGSGRKRCNFSFGSHLRKMSEHMDVLQVTMSKLCRNLQNYEERRDWVKWGLIHGGRAAIECKAAYLRADAVERAVKQQAGVEERAAKLRAAAVERAVYYDSDSTTNYDSDPEVVDVHIMEVEERMLEEDEVEYVPTRRGKVAPPLHEQGRVGDNVYEVFQVQPRSRMQQDVLIKNDPGAQVTFIDPDLFKFGLKEGFIKNQRDFETEEMLGIGGSTYINTIADMQVCIEGSLIPVTIQVVLNKAIEDRNFQVLLGTDNTQYMGASINLGEKHTTYSKLKGINRTLTSMHLAGESATRVFNSSRVCESATRMDKELGNIPEKVGMKARSMDDKEALGMVDSMATEDTKLLYDRVTSRQSGDLCEVW
jgi:hypothetical protein